MNRFGVNEEQMLVEGAKTTKNVGGKKAQSPVKSGIQ